jgi:hypothetical protein
MDDANLSALRHLAAAFRHAIESARAERAPGALPYFPDGACRMTSRLLALHLARRPDGELFGPPQLVSGILPDSASAVRHSWLEVDEVVVDLTADPFGEAPVLVGARTAFHESLISPVVEDAAAVLGSLGAAETERLTRQLAAIEARLSGFTSPAA